VAAPMDRMEYAAKTFASLWVDDKIRIDEARDLVGPLYREDAVFISPNPPLISAEFGTTLNGRDEIMKYHETCMKVYPTRAVSTKYFLFGINLALWVYEPIRRAIPMADILLFDQDGLIEMQRVTSAGLEPSNA
jgi:hypothetical protein